MSIADMKQELKLLEEVYSSATSLTSHEQEQLIALTRKAIALLEICYDDRRLVSQGIRDLDQPLQ